MARSCCRKCLTLRYDFAILFGCKYAIVADNDKPDTSRDCNARSAVLQIAQGVLDHMANFPSDNYQEQQHTLDELLDLHGIAKITAGKHCMMMTLTKLATCHNQQYQH